MISVLCKISNILQKISFVQCNCIRCKDATEMGTYSSALLCSKCAKGIVLSSNAQIIQADWKCDKCDFVVRHHLNKLLHITDTFLVV